MTVGVETHSPRLWQLAQAVSRAPSADVERCELCGLPIDDKHPHLFDVEHDDVRCACRACALLFDRSAAAGGKLRRIPDRRWRIPPSADEERAWAAFGIPVDLAFVATDASGGVAVSYPAPVGTTTSTVDADTWAEFVALHPVLMGLEPHVEALLTRARRDVRDLFIVPIDDCFRLVGLLRRNWRGFSGGQTVWNAIDEYFESLDERARDAPAAVPRSGGTSKASN